VILHNSPKPEKTAICLNPFSIGAFDVVKLERIIHPAIMSEAKFISLKSLERQKTD
jgi:hypothetical protein